MTLIGCLLPALNEMLTIVLERKRNEDREVDFHDDDSEYQMIGDESACHSAGPYDPDSGFESEMEEQKFSDSHSNHSVRSLSYSDGQHNVLV